MTYMIGPDENFKLSKFARDVILLTLGIGVAAIAGGALGARLMVPNGGAPPAPRVIVAHDAPPLASDSAPDSALVRAAWEYVRGCSGLSPMMGRGIERVNWRVAPSGTLWVEHRQALGLYLAPSTIVLDASALNNKVVVAHELLHYLLNGPPVEYGGPHPALPFAWPCELMLFQHADDAP